MDLSIIIPTTQRRLQLAEAVASVLPLESVSFEVLIVSDSAESFADNRSWPLNDPRVRHIRHDRPAHGRPAALRNQGAFHHACGRFLYFLDDDDVADPGALSRMVSCLQQSPDCGVAIGAIEPKGPLSSPEISDERLHYMGAREILKRSQSRLALVSRLLFAKPLLVCSACVLRRGLFVEIGGFDRAIPLYEDVDLFARAIRKGGFAFVDEVVLRRSTGAGAMRYDMRSHSSLISDCYRRLYESYKVLYGSHEYYLLRVLAAAIL